MAASMITLCSCTMRRFPHIAPQRKQEKQSLEDLPAKHAQQHFYIYWGLDIHLDYEILLKIFVQLHVHLRIVCDSAPWVFSILVLSMPNCDYVILISIDWAIWNRISYLASLLFDILKYGQYLHHLAPWLPQSGSSSLWLCWGFPAIASSNSSLSLVPAPLLHLWSSLCLFATRYPFSTSLQPHLSFTARAPYSFCESASRQFDQQSIH